MSAASFDDSSNLVDVSVPDNGAEKTNADVAPDKQLPELPDESTDLHELKVEDSKSKSKKSRAKRLLKRAKSPISGAINKTTKEFKKLSNLPKHHYSSPKSPSKSPSKENLTDEYAHLEEKLGEKKSEEWLAFQQMQERIKHTVLKTQSSLHKYNSQSEDDEQKSGKLGWTDFDEGASLEPEELIDTSLAPSISISCVNSNSGFDDKQNLIDISSDKSHLGAGPKSSPPISPGPPVNSRISSMENLLPDHPKESEESSTKAEEEVDLLGLLDGPEQSMNIETSNKSADLMTEDLLGLEGFLPPVPASSFSDASSTAPQTSEVQILSGYTFTSSTSGDLTTSTSTQEQKATKEDKLFLDQADTTVPDTGVQAAPVDMLVDNFDVLEATPAPPVQTSSEPAKTEDNMLAMFGEPLDPLAPEPVTVSVSKPEADTNLVESSNTAVMDDFSSFDPMKADTVDVGFTPAASSFDPFKQSSSPVTIMSNTQGGVSSVYMFGTSPQSYGSVPAGAGSIDLLSKIKMMSSGSQPVSPARRMAPKPPKDHFGFVKKQMKKDKDVEVDTVDNNDDDDSYKSLADIGKPKPEPVVLSDTLEDTAQKDINTDASHEANVTNNPFLTGDFETTLTTTSNITENAAAVFGLDEEIAPKQDESEFDFNKAWETDIGDTKRQQWTDVDALDGSGTLFEGSDFTQPVGGSGVSAWDTQASESKPADAWGSETETLTESSNPFQDDFSKLDDVPAEDVASASANPFLSGDITSNATVDQSSVINPFLNFDGEQPVASDQSGGLLASQPMVLSDSENFFMDSVSDSQPDASVVTDDIFDPFKVTSKAPAVADPGTGDTLDIFSSAAPLEDKQHDKPADFADFGFKLEIKPASETSKADSSSPAPILKPPPKAPKSPQPPRENPFDRDSPPEENFAQFEIKDIEKPREPPPKSISTDSTTTEEEEILEPLEPFLPKSDKEGFKIMLRYPTKKKIAGNRYWKNVFVKIAKQSDGPVIKVFNDAKDSMPLQELPLQPCYSLSDVALQQYDQYGKIHTVKLQYVFYKERVGIKTERITPSIVKFKKREKPKATMILDHSPQVSELLKFGGLDKAEINEFIREVEDTFMNLEAHREKTLTYAKDEVTAEVHDEYIAELNKFGKVLSQKARVRIFVLAFLTGMPKVEVGLNDKRRRGKEVVGRCDIIPIKTEEWIRLEDVEFHNCVDKPEFEKTNNIIFHPLDACQFELLRYRVHLRQNKELPLQLTVQQIFKNRKCEIRCDLLVTGYHSYSKKHGQFPCEDIEVRFPIPETWIYMFRYERRFGYGSIHSATRKPGKIKGLERLTMMAQGHFNQTLMEADVGTAKYEHVYRSVVWRIPRLPVRNQGAYTSHLMKLRLELGPHDEVPDSFENYAHVEFTMPCSTTSQSQIRSIAVTNPNPPEKWVRSMAHYQYRIEIEHLDEYPEMMAIGSVYKEATMVSPTKSEEENNEPQERDPRLAVSDTDSSDSD